MTPRDLNPHQTCLMFIITELGVSYHTKCYFFQILSKDVQQFSSFILDSLLLVGNCSTCSTTGVFSTISGSSQKAIICSMSLKFSFLPFTMLGEFQSTMVQQPKSLFLYSCNCSIFWLCWFSIVSDLAVVPVCSSSSSMVVNSRSLVAKSSS